MYVLMGQALTGEGALVLKMDILRPQLDARALQTLGSSKEADCHWADNNLGLGGLGHIPQRGNQLDRLARRHIHFPVTGNHRSSHTISPNSK